MHKTKLRNGVLFVLALDERKFIIFGDKGINKKVPDDFWESTKDIVIKNFKKDLFAKGLAEGIKLSGKQLAKFFPCEKGDVNELPNAISYENEENVK